METKTKIKTTKVKTPVQDKKVIDAHRSILSKTEASEQQLRKVIASEVDLIQNSIKLSNFNLRLKLSEDITAEFRHTFKPVVFLLAIIIFLQFAILVN